MSRFFTLLVLVCVLACAGCAGRCLSGNCREGQGVLQFSEGGNYMDGWGGWGWGDRKGLPGGLYVGEFRNGIPYGHGTMTEPDGAKYVGNFAPILFNNQRSYYSGQGTMTWSDGRKYVGEWAMDKPSGQGTMTWLDGRKYEGQWKDGKRSGYGTTIYADGSHWRGQWADSNLLRNMSAEEFAAILPIGAVRAQSGKPENFVAQRQRLEAEKQRLETEKQKLAAEAVEVQRLDAERQRLEAENLSIKLQKAQLAARPKPSNIDGPKERRLALVIGNSAYPKGPLKNPANDAQDMAAALKHLGFDVTMLTDATNQQMESAVRDFGLKLRQGGVGLFYYAGHGVQVAGSNYLIPVNAVIQSEGDVKFGSLDAGLVLAKMEDAGNGLNIVILDACRSNPYARSFRTGNEGLAKMDAPTGSLISYATAPGSVASDGTGRNGVFTRHLLENMKEPGLPISEVLMRVRQGVVKETAKKQVPWEASSLIGQFYFSE